MTLCHADITSKNEKKVERYKNNLKRVYSKIKDVEERDQIRNWRPPIDGEIIMNKLKLNPSKKIGVIKMKIQDAILDGEIENNYNSAETYMYKIAKELGIEY